MKEKGKEQEERGDFGALGEGSKDLRMKLVKHTLDRDVLSFPT